MRTKRAFNNVISNLLLQLIIILYGFIVPKIIIESFGSNVNGLVSSITQFIAYISLLEVGFGPVVKAALYKPIAKKNKKEIENILRASEKFFRVISYIFIIYIILLCIIYPFIVINDFNYIYTLSLIIIISISTFAEYFFGMTYRLYLQADQRGYITSIIQIVSYIISIIVILILVKCGSNIHIIKLVGSLLFLLRPIIQNIYVKKKYNINLNNADSTYKLKQKWDGLAQHIASVVHTNTDIIILTFFVSLSEISVYSVYYLVVKGIKSIVQSLLSGIDSSFGDMMAKNEYDNLNKKFNLYEILYFTSITIIFSCTLVLITPFIKVYTKDITDVNYIRYLFGYLIVISEYIWSVRLPYSTTTLAAGHFKETRLGAWIEALTNVIISIILVIKYGIVGVTIGTIIAMLIRTIEFVIHTNRYILNRSVLFTLYKIIILIIETIVIVLICNYIPYLDNVSYINWFINAFITFIISILIVLIINIIVYKKYIKEIFNRFRKK